MVAFCKSKCLALPIPSMGLVYLPTFGVFFVVNVGKYTIHGWHGLVLLMFCPVLVVHLFTCALALYVLKWIASMEHDLVVKTQTTC